MQYRKQTVCRSATKFCKRIEDRGFDAQHVIRPLVPGGPTRGGSLAIIYRDHFEVRPVDFHFNPTTFQFQSLLLSTVSPPVLLVNIYQPHSPPAAAFYDELSTLLANIATESTASTVLCDDVNCHDANSWSVNANLDDVFISYNLQQHVHEPTCDSNLLDILATSTAGAMAKVRVVDCGVSNHCLITAKIHARRPPLLSLQFTFCNWKRLDIAEFESSLRHSSLFTIPAKTANAFALQLRSVVTQQLNTFDLNKVYHHQHHHHHHQVI